jgi:hypothetical protein
MYCGSPLLGQYGGTYTRYIPNGYRLLGAVLGYGVRLRTRRCQVRFPVMAFPCNPLITMHTNANGSVLVSTSLGEWNNSSLDSYRMFIGANNGWGTTTDSRLARFWDGYATKVTIDDRPLTGEEATAIYNSTNPSV